MSSFLPALFSIDSLFFDGFLGIFPIIILHTLVFLSFSVETIRSISGYAHNPKIPVCQDFRVDEFPCHDNFDAPEDQIRCVPSLDHDNLETFDPYPAEMPLNVQIMSWILEDQQVLQFNCLGDFFPQIIISGHSVPVATLLRGELQTCCTKFVLAPDKPLPFRMKRPFVNSLFEIQILLS
jgi:hypothetical protein